VEAGRCLRSFKGHTAPIWSVAWSADQRYALSGSEDKTIGLWDVETGQRLRVLEGHTHFVWSVAWSADQRLALSGAVDHTVRLWEVDTGRCLRVLEGHTAHVRSVVWSANQRHALSVSDDKTVRLWDVETGRCLRVLKGHTGEVRSVAWSADHLRAFSGDRNGGICVWDLSEFLTAVRTPENRAPALPVAPDQIQYTNAKVLLVGESGAGKTGLTERLAHDTFTPSYSTSGTWSTQWQMKDLPLESGWEREVWLWDFGGQADQRLIHQLYLDKTALILLVFNADRDAVLPGLREWQQALSRSVPDKTRTYLVAGRIDVGFRFDREKVRAFAEQHGYRYFETSANDGRGCLELRKAIQTDIPWTQLERRTSPTTWKLLNNEILKLRDEGQVLFTFKELRETLRQRLAVEAKFTDTDLETVVGLLDGPGVVKELSFGTYILLRPEWINAYAQAVIRTLRAEAKSLGCLPVQSIAAGRLIFQSQQASGEIVEEKRLGAREEPIVLQAMEQMLLERRLCLRQEGNLVFPSYCGLEKPTGPVPPKYFISYVFGGFLDDIYATLIVKLAYCGAFRLKELWRDAADFDTLADQRTMGIKLLRNEDGQGTLLVHFSRAVTPQEQVIFANYIHDHLVEKATEPQRQRHFVCPHCDTPVSNREVAMRKLAELGKEARIICVNCEQHMPLWDALEERFASDETKQQVAALQKQERFVLDARRKGKLLALEVAARITSADQKCFEIPGVEDEGLDLEVEFTDDDGRGTGKRIFLQLKAGNSYLQRRKGDGAEIFKIKKQAWVDYWMKQECPVLLVIGTFPDERDEFRKGSQERFVDIRWMEINEDLRLESKDGTQPVKQIVFKGETLDTLSVRGWRRRWGKVDSDHKKPARSGLYLAPTGLKR
jgi:small GTP-binding protein